MGLRRVDGKIFDPILGKEAFDPPESCKLALGEKIFILREQDKYFESFVSMYSMMLQYGVYCANHSLELMRLEGLDQEKTPELYRFVEGIQAKATEAQMAGQSSEFKHKKKMPD